MPNPSRNKILNPGPFKSRGSGYDYKSARKAGLGPDKTGHWPSRVPKTGLILKGSRHPTFKKTVEGEKKAGMKIFRRNGRLYSRPKK